MNPNPAAKLFREPAHWPHLPPWWLLTTTEVAGLLHVKANTLTVWRIRGYGPEIVPPMYLKPTQGQPLWYQYGVVRGWAAEKLGMTYGFDDQCADFLGETSPFILKVWDDTESRIEAFEMCLENDRLSLQRGKTPGYLKADLIHALDPWRAKQPGRVSGGPPRAYYLPKPPCSLIE